ncbi:LuxR family transcriptional regulator [Paraburkholderia sediminicola]|uniref:helix-turn-helix transcriptional regulator n=1 Tax=Paraburkholderia sediminicola TaxID=458836 RepID=UPI0038BBFF27
MEVRTIDLSPAGPADCASIAAAIVGRIGEAGFAGDLISSLARILRVGHLSAFAFRPDYAPQLLGTSSVVSPGIAHDTAFVYLDRHYLADPTLSLREASRTLNGQALFVQRQRSHDVLDDGYRASCYDQPGIIDRVSVVQARSADSDTWIAVNIYRDRSQGFFSDSDLDLLSTVAPIVTSATERHLHMTEMQAQLATQVAAAPGARRDAAPARLAASFPQLSRREREVCEGILAGLTAKQIAWQLEIAPTSVVTHRKNAYLKLGIHDLKQLFGLTA